MIARELRLRNERDVARVQSTGKSWSSRLVVAIVSPNGLEQNRYGFAAGRRIGRIAQRNRAKRLMREVVRELHPQLKTGHDILFIARNRVNRETTLSEMRDEIYNLLDKAGVLDHQHDA